MLLLVEFETVGVVDDSRRRERTQWHYPNRPLLAMDHEIEPTNESFTISWIGNDFQWKRW